MKYVLCLFLVSCSGYSNVTYIHWKDMQEGPQKESCRKCAKDAHVQDCNVCVGNK